MPSWAPSFWNTVKNGSPGCPRLKISGASPAPASSAKTAPSPFVLPESRYGWMYMDVAMCGGLLQSSMATSAWGRRVGGRVAHRS
eukprot:scaffold8875_cov51-Phaeocystis_antarctica.AAC.3